MTGYDSKRKIAQDRLDDDDIQVYAQPAHEPVGSVVSWLDGSLVHGWFGDPPPEGTLLYITPQPRPWVGLTDEDIKTVLSQLYCDLNQMKLAPVDRLQKETVGFLFAKGIEQTLKERNL